MISTESFNGIASHPFLHLNKRLRDLSLWLPGLVGEDASPAAVVQSARFPIFKAASLPHLIPKITIGMFLGKVAFGARLVAHWVDWLD